MAKLSYASLIGISGVMNAGKDTVANLIIALRPRELRRYSFATPLKAGVCAMFGWTKDEIENRDFKEAVDPRWGFSPRKAMQLLGTEYGRVQLRDDLWVHAGANFHDESVKQNKGTIITDVRFENEAAWVRSVPNSVLIHVINPDYNYNAPVKHISELGVKYEHGDIQIMNYKGQGLSYLHESLVELW